MKSYNELTVTLRNAKNYEKLEHIILSRLEVSERRFRNLMDNVESGLIYGLPAIEAHGRNTLILSELSHIVRAGCDIELNEYRDRVYRLANNALEAIYDANERFY